MTLGVQQSGSDYCFDRLFVLAVHCEMSGDELIKTRTVHLYLLVSVQKISEKYTSV